ncbi:hypothetical protein E2C01_030689 [Portunus trituberculatus]|uniref:Uncharacterized protein n=1 Tax=Portunus trituberculatus TaxID=210409 RepID=A0A5B7EUW4_PORTR|nr:hypothetical protein [Portunus trituberculatus]
MAVHGSHAFSLGLFPFPCTSRRRLPTCAPPLPPSTLLLPTVITTLRFVCYVTLVFVSMAATVTWRLKFRLSRRLTLAPAASVIASKTRLHVRPIGDADVGWPACPARRTVTSSALSGKINLSFNGIGAARGKVERGGAQRGKLTSHAGAAVQADSPQLCPALPRHPTHSRRRAERHRFSPVGASGGVGCACAGTLESSARGAGNGIG